MNLGDFVMVFLPFNEKEELRPYGLVAVQNIEAFADEWQEMELKKAALYE